ncbi:MAG: hypothetical protein MUE85_21880 [Microscillaceae bacterium]|nr:hypothetical protein [Microscillaceae bacterium]
MVIKYLAIFLHPATHVYTPLEAEESGRFRNHRHEQNARASFFYLFTTLREWGGASKEH